MVKEIWKKVIWLVMAVLFLAMVFRPLCMAEGCIDYWKLLFLMGIPFGVQKMFVWLIPSGWKESETGSCNPEKAINRLHRQSDITITYSFT